jgi:hypothetical protein
MSLRHATRASAAAIIDRAFQDEDRIELLNGSKPMGEITATILPRSVEAMSASSKNLSLASSTPFRCSDPAFAPACMLDRVEAFIRVGLENPSIPGEMPRRRDLVGDIGACREVAMWRSNNAAARWAARG